MPNGTAAPSAASAASGAEPKSAALHHAAFDPEGAAAPAVCQRLGSVRDPECAGHQHQHHRSCHGHHPIVRAGPPPDRREPADLPGAYRARARLRRRRGGGLLPVSGPWSRAFGGRVEGTACPTLDRPLASPRLRRRSCPAGHRLPRPRRDSPGAGPSSTRRSERARAASDVARARRPTGRSRVFGTARAIEAGDLKRAARTAAGSPFRGTPPSFPVTVEAV